MGDHDRYTGEDQWINHDPGAELQTLAQARQEREALQLRVGGASYIEIGEHLGITARDASRLVDRAIKAEVPTELRDQTRALILARLDVVVKRNMIKLVSPAASAAEQDRAEDMILKTTDRITDITGARAPVQVDVHNHDALDEEIALMVQDLTKPIPPPPNVTPPGRTEDDRVNPERSARSGRWQARMHRGDRPGSTGDRRYDDPTVS